jgi:serine/threonine protein kinase
MSSVEILGHRCTLGDLIGAGGMGHVYAVTHPELGPLAVKLLAPELAQHVHIVDRIREEGRLAAKIDHRNVVRVVDHGVTAEGLPFVVMRYTAGEPLGLLVQREGPLSLARVRTIGAQVLAGLEAIHAAGVVHADLKSDNLLLDVVGGDDLTIIDFGLARPPLARLRDDDRIVSGTPEYMAPELIRGQPITIAADLYAVGVILYELVTGTTPFAGGSAAEIFTRQLDDDVIPPSLRCPDREIPPALDALILFALAKHPAHRPRSARVFGTALRSAILPNPDEELLGQLPAFTTTGPTRRWARAS